MFDESLFAVAELILQLLHCYLISLKYSLLSFFYSEVELKPKIFYPN